MGPLYRLAKALGAAPHVAAKPLLQARDITGRAVISLRCADGCAYREDFAFPMLDRATIIGTVIGRLGDKVSCVGTRAEFDALTGARPIVLVTVDDRSLRISKHVLQGLDYLRFIGACDFFFAPPG